MFKNGGAGEGGVGCLTLTYMMHRKRQMSGVFKIYYEPES